ncbi:MAG TPA: cupredoxin domain-containing protein [Acidimicrobiales bacterium]|jgi:plastocyanin|nr:cupredoxin domain-containing protein [Acidimicrobiales bacterium]
MRFRALAALFMLTLGVAACGSSSTTSSTTVGGAATTTPAAGSTATSAPAAGGTAMTISGFAFKPNPASFKVGSTVTVTNQDSTDHSLTATDGSFDTGVFSSGSKTITLSKVGTFTIHCRIHNFMTGTITVTS